jgi:hypothetical protein
VVSSAPATPGLRPQGISTTAGDANLGIDLLKTPEQEAAEGPGLPHLTVDRLDDRFALGEDR